MEIKKITAQDARELSNTSQVSLKRIYRFIEDAAKENKTTIWFHLEYPSEDAVKEIISDLRTNGYEVISRVVHDTTTLEIKW